MTLYPEKQIRYASRSLRFELFEHFLNFPTTSGSVSGSLDLQVSLASGAVSLAGSDAAHPGVIRLSTGIVATGRAGLQTGLNAVLLGSGVYEIEFSFKLSSSLSDATNTYSMWLGFSDSITGIGANTAGLYYSSASNTNFLYVCRKASVETAIASSVVADLNWHIINIVVDKPGNNAVFTLDNTTPVTVSTNVPNTNRIGLCSYILKSVGTTARTLDIDYETLKADFT
jgi:hypothetical protein